MLQTSGSVEVGGSFDLGSALEAIVVAAVVATDIVVTPLLIVVLPAKGAGLPSIEVERPHSIAFRVLVGLDIRVEVQHIVCDFIKHLTTATPTHSRAWSCVKVVVAVNSFPTRIAKEAFALRASHLIAPRSPADVDIAFRTLTGLS